MYSQKIEKFYDYKWEETEPSQARFYSVVERTDSGYVQRDYYIQRKTLQMTGKYADSDGQIRDGHFDYYYPSGSISISGRYVKNKREGLWLGYHSNGMMRDSGHYDKNKPIGTHFKWYSNGVLWDSTTYNVDGSGVKVEWFSNGSPLSAGYFDSNGNQKGRWKYYHNNGKISSIEDYHNGKLIDKKYYDESGSPMSDTTDRTSEVKFSKTKGEWTKYLSKNLYFPEGYALVGADNVVIVVDFSVDEDGVIDEVNVRVPFYPVFDDIAVKVIRASPKWIPGFIHNRRVRTWHTQSVNFVQTE